MSKTNWLNEQNNSSTLASRFLVFFYALHDYDVKPPDASSWCNVLWRRWTYDHEFSFLFSFWTWIESLRIQLHDANSFFSDLFTAVVDVIAEALDYEQSLFFLWFVEQNARHANGHARDWWRCRLRFTRVAASPLPRACIALTKSEEKERLLAVLSQLGR